MKSNFKTILFVVLIALVIFTRFFYKVIPHRSSAPAVTSSQTDARPSAPTQSTPPPATSGDHQSIIDPNVNLIYTKHARCRMDCRHISEADIREVLREGHVNEAKSKQEPGKCPAYAIEDNRNSDGIRLRIVFAKCDHEVKVVTCIDRDDEFPCDCK
jgi:hypothetical protein